MKKFLLILFCFICFILNAFSQENNSKDNVSDIQKVDSILAVFFVQRDSMLRERFKEPYPDFVAISLSGDTITRSQLEGKVTLINFWFENCAPCIEEFPDLSELYSKFKDNPDFLFVSFTRDPIEDALVCAYKYELPYKVYPIMDECMRLSFEAGFPTTIILDPYGMVKYYKMGHIRMEESEELIKNLLSTR